VKSSLKVSCKHMHSIPNSSSLFSPSCAYYIQSSTPLHHSLVMQRKSGGKETVLQVNESEQCMSLLSIILTVRKGSTGVNLLQLICTVAKAAKYNLLCKRAAKDFC
jgi:hypothetical protein